MYHSSHPDYKISDKFEYTVSTRDMVKQRLHLIFYGKKNQEKLGDISVPLYTIATGPALFDFNINSLGGYVGRCSFHVKMSQKIQVKIKSTTLVARTIENLTEKNYFYTVSLLDGEEIIDSEKSAEFENCF